MDLPKSIVKEFAKQAVEKKPTVDKPTQLVGTVHVEDGQTFVYLDGSNGSKTPVSETVAYQSGDRVLVSIQNRKATIIGNYTDPSINQALDNVIVEYALSSSSVSFIAWPGEKGEWNTIAPEKEDGSYMWQRTTKISTNPLINPEISLTCIQGSDGKNGYTPYIGSNGNWWINGVDTGYSAEGDDGHSPYVDTTTNTWWEWDADIGGYHDTGIVPQGPGVFKSIVFKRFSSQPSTPTEGSYLSPVPSGWSDGIPSGTEQIWISTRVFTSDGKSPQTSEWTTPQMVSDTPDIDFEYSWIVTNPGNPTDNPGNWSNEATENSIWMAVRKKSIGTWSSWEINKIKGEMSAEQLAQLNQASEDASTAKDSVDTLSDKTRTGFIETLSGSGFVQSTKTEDGGAAEVVVYGKSVQGGTPTPEAPVEIQSVENPKVEVCGKNLIDISEWIPVCTTIKNGIFTSNINNEHYSYIATYSKTLRSLLMQNIGETITFSIDKVIVGQSMSIVLYGTRSDGETYQESTLNNIRSVNLTISDTWVNITQIELRWNRNDIPFTDTTTTVTNLQLELGKSATDYEPYTAKTATLSDIVLRATPDGTRDRIFKNTDGLWKVERNVYRYILSDNEGSIAREASSRFANYNTPKSLKDGCGYCNCLSVSGAPLGNAGDHVITAYTGGGVFFMWSEYETESALREQLATNPLIFDYPLATPTYEVLPDSIQAELNALTTYNPITNVIVSDGVTPDIDVSFWTRDYYAKNAAENAQIAADNAASKDELAITDENIRQDIENNYYSHTELGQSLSFNETDGLIIQVPNSPYETRISNTQIEFRYQGQPVAYINGEILVIPKSMMLDEMMVGNNKWSWRIRDNGNLQLKWIG